MTGPITQPSRNRDSGFGEFGQISLGPSTAPRRNELDEYLAVAVESVEDPLLWWWDNRHIYPILHRLALDYLSIPGEYRCPRADATCLNQVIDHSCHLATSTAVERVFSQGRHLLPFTRNRLSAASTRALMCLGSWGRADLLHITDLVEAMGTRRKKRKRASHESADVREGSGDHVQPR